jgi:F1F0 ATPase subunit 2
MRDALMLLLAWIAGGVLGAFFFGGLWWTVRQVVWAERPALWVFGSLMLRMSVALAGIYFVSGHHLDRLLACFFGFVMARLLVTQITMPPGETERRSTSETSHAP